MGRLQPLAAKLGEVRFRQKLVKQHLGKERSIPKEPDRKEIIKILKQRINATRKILKKLKNKDFLLSPFLEIGAEKGQRSMLLVNEFGAQGFAADLSLESLASAGIFAESLGFQKLPTLLCCDAHHLPFKDNRFPFVFCFETLHHFPDPSPIVKEIYRVLAPGGIFYFGEEPVKQTFNLNLWRRGYHLNPLEKFLKAIGILPFLTKIGKSEVNHGILEEEFSLKTWQKALSIFEKAELMITPVFFGPSSPLVKNQSFWVTPSLITSSLIALQGGGIEGLAVKKGERKLAKDRPIAFICPDCKKNLAKKEKGFSCPRCQRQFSRKNGVLMILPFKLHQKLYG